MSKFNPSLFRHATQEPESGDRGKQDTNGNHPPVLTSTMLAAQRWARWRFGVRNHDSDAATPLMNTNAASGTTPISGDVDVDPERLTDKCGLA